MAEADWETPFIAKAYFRNPKELCANNRTKKSRIKCHDLAERAYSYNKMPTDTEEPEAAKRE